jgi:hypothetical protein
VKSLKAKLEAQQAAEAAAPPGTPNSTAQTTQKLENTEKELQELNDAFLKQRVTLLTKIAMLQVRDCCSR